MFALTLPRTATPLPSSHSTCNAICTHPHPLRSFIKILLFLFPTSLSTSSPTANLTCEHPTRISNSTHPHTPTRPPHPLPSPNKSPLHLLLPSTDSPHARASHTATVASCAPLHLQAHCTCASLPPPSPATSTAHATRCPPPYTRYTTTAGPPPCESRSPGPTSGTPRTSARTPSPFARRPGMTRPTGPPCPP